MQNTAEKTERAALAGLAAASMDARERSTEISMAELAALVETAGGEAVVSVLQNKQTPDPRTFLGEGKVAELKECIQQNPAAEAAAPRQERAAARSRPPHRTRGERPPR